MKPKKPAIGGPEPRDRQPRIAIDPNDASRQAPAWRFGLLQLDGPWSWATIGPDTMHWVRDKLCRLEQTNWNDICRGGSHNVERYKLVTRARNRLDELGLGDTEELFSLRLGGTERIWGIRILNVLRILWWDPDHEVCPSGKRHT